MGASQDKDNSVDVSKLKDFTADINITSTTGTTNLHFVALGENIQLAQWLLQNGAEFTLNRKGQTALHWACKSGHLPMVKLILSYIPQYLISVVDVDGTTALDWAYEYGNNAARKCLMKKLRPKKHKKK